MIWDINRHQPHTISHKPMWRVNLTQHWVGHQCKTPLSQRNRHNFSPIWPPDTSTSHNLSPAHVTHQSDTTLKGLDINLGNSLTKPLTQLIAHAIIWHIILTWSLSHPCYASIWHNYGGWVGQHQSYTLLSQIRGTTFRPRDHLTHQSHIISHLPMSYINLTQVLCVISCTFTDFPTFNHWKNACCAPSKLGLTKYISTNQCALTLRKQMAAARAIKCFWFKQADRIRDATENNGKFEPRAGGVGDALGRGELGFGGGGSLLIF